MDTKRNKEIITFRDALDDSWRGYSVFDARLCPYLGDANSPAYMWRNIMFAAYNHVRLAGEMLPLLSVNDGKLAAQDERFQDAAACLICAVEQSLPSTTDDERAKRAQTVEEVAAYVDALALEFRTLMLFVRNAAAFYAMEAA